MNTPIENPGSAQGQIVLLTNRIAHLTEHLKKNKKDHAAKKGLLDLVSQRSRMLKYLYRQNVSLHKILCEKLSLKK